MADDIDCCMPFLQNTIAIELSRWRYVLRFFPISRGGTAIRVNAHFFIRNADSLHAQTLYA